MRAPSSTRHLNQILSNIDGDVRLADDEKSDARARAADQLSHLTSDPDAPTELWSNHCAVALAALASPAEPHSRADGARVGNIWAIRPFQGSVGRQLHCNQKEAERIVELCCIPADDLDEDERDELAELYERLTLREGDECWLFDGPSSAENPFAGVDLDALSCRLGLPYRVGEDFVTFVVPPPANTRRPCVLDVDWFFQQFWRPGGRTRAFCAASTAEGLNEWIARPPLIRDTGGPMSRHRVVDGNPIGALPYDVA